MATQKHIKKKRDTARKGRGGGSVDVPETVALGKECALCRVRLQLFTPLP